jgi:hypothetical protein
MTGGGIEIWNGGDNMNFLYREVSGDFVATAHVLSRDLQGSAWGKYGLMARQNCHPDSRHEFMASNSSTGGTRHTERLDHIVPDPNTNREVYIVEPGVVPGSPMEGAPAVPGNPSPATNPDHYMLIRTESQVTGYVSWDDPNSPGDPFHWCLVGSTNHQDRFDDLFVGMAINAGETADPLSSIDFSIDIQPYAIDTQSLVSTGVSIFTLDFEAEADFDFPNDAVPGDVFRGSGFTPVVRDGRLRMTQDGVTNSATAAFWSDPSLANILDSGFVAEFDVSASTTGVTGEGGTFVVIASGSDLLPDPDDGPPDGPPVDETPVGIFQNRILMEHPGRESLGQNNNTEFLGGDSYVSTAETGRDIWAPGDTMEYAYNIFEGDFDVSVRIDDVSHSTGEGCWGKFGIMARQTLDTNSRMCQISNHGPKGVVPGATGACPDAPGPGSCANLFGRTNHLDPANGAPNMFEDEPVLDPCFARYLRLKRDGLTITGYVSDDPAVESFPTDDARWIRTGRDFSTADGGACWYVGFANHDHETAGAQVQEVEFTLIKWDGTPAGDCTDVETGNPVGDFSDVQLIEHPGRPSVGTNNDVVFHGGSTYTSIAETGQDIWNPGDTFVYAYNQFNGDFDLSLRIDEMRHSTGVGCWGKYGIMARRDLTSTSPMAVSARNGPAQISRTLDGTAENGAPACPNGPGADPANSFGKAANFFSRAPGGGLAETGAGGEFSISLNYLRLTRVGDTIRGYASDNPAVEGDPTNDALWTETSPGGGYSAGGLDSCLLVGFCNHEHSVEGAQIQEIDFTLIKWDGTSCGAPTGGPELTTSVFGNAGAGLGFGGEVTSSTTTPLRERNECHPMFALEIDTSSVESSNRLQFAGVNNEGTGSYHIGLNTNASTGSRQINEQIGVVPGDLPNLFNPASPVHIEVEYKPNGEIQAWANDILVIETYIPPLTLGAGLAEPLIGFTGATGANSQTLEFDNLTITPLSPGGTPLGACCTDGSCDIQSQTDCQTGGGVYQGDGTNCGGVDCQTGPEFRRGDHDGSGLVDITDPLNTLGFLFLGTTPPICLDASDGDNSGIIDISDPLNILSFLFLGSVEIPLPSSAACGLDPSEVILAGTNLGINVDQPAVTLGCDTYPNPVFLPTAACE